MNSREYFERVAQLERDHISFALATVVVRRAPVSAHLGDRAIVLADGRMEGFVGGSCSRDIVRRQALDAIRTGRPRLLRIRPDRVERENADDTGETVVVPMSCSSEGAVDVYVEPYLPPRLMLVAGFTPVANALVKVAGALEAYRVVRVVAHDELGDLERGDVAVSVSDLGAFLAGLEPGERARMVAIVASQGHYDEATLELLLTGELPAFTGLLASRKRAATVFGVLAQSGISPDRIAAVHNPAGLDVGARSPGEVAISILAQIVAEGSHARVDVPPHRAAALDPVCGMEVDAPGDFCSAHCRAAFEADPSRYASVPTS